MRKSLLDQLPLVPGRIDHPHAHELATIGVLLDRLPKAVELVHEDLGWRGGKRVDPRKGRNGLAAEQVLRIGILKQITGFSYEQLRFHLLDSSTYRAFCRLGYGELPKKSTLQKNVKRIKAETWEAINQMVIVEAKNLGVDDCATIRTDCTVVESNIHPPTDSSLLWDCVRVLTRIMGTARDTFGVAVKDRTKAAKRRS